MIFSTLARTNYKRQLRIDVFICKLRKKLASTADGQNYIETVWGRGYVLHEPNNFEMRQSA